MGPDNKLVSLTRRILGWPRAIFRSLLVRLPYFRFIEGTKDAAHSISFEMWSRQFLLAPSSPPYWPVSPTSRIYNWRNVHVGRDTAPGINGGCYIQAFGPIVIGDYVNIAANCGIISANHDMYDGRRHEVNEVVIGDRCWIGMNSVILPGVYLGDFTIVAAGAVVKDSFPDGYQVLAGVPARVVRHLDRDKCKPFNEVIHWHGYVHADDFGPFREQNLTPECRALADRVHKAKPNPVEE